MVIALTYTGSTEKHENYIRWLKQNDESIEIITLDASENNLQDIVGCDALLLSGGIDIYPDYYHGDHEYLNAPEGGFNKARDEMEIAAFHHAQESKKPVLGVCRGLQLVNTILGGSMKQDLGELNVIHRAENLVDKLHTINVKPGTLLASIVGNELLKVNSAHHQSIDKVGEGLLVNCQADDGTVEGLERAEANGLPFLLCVQWHPERMYKYQLQDSPVSKSIRNRFLQEIQKTL